MPSETLKRTLERQRQWERLRERYGGRCLMCGEAKELTRDHVIPLSCGGERGKGNLQPLCYDCNQAKGDMTIDFRGLRPRYFDEDLGMWMLWLPEDTERLLKDYRDRVFGRGMSRRIAHLREKEDAIARLLQVRENLRRIASG